jgi:hypothetical protein
VNRVRLEAHLTAVTGSGAIAMNTICATDIFVVNQHVDVTQLSCPTAWLYPFSTCPMHYTIVNQVNGNSLQIAVPGCSADTRPTDMTQSHQLLRLQPPRLEGLWQTPCTYDVNTHVAFSNELQILNGNYFSSASFIYTSSDCNPASLAMKVHASHLIRCFLVLSHLLVVQWNAAGMVDLLQLETQAPANTYDVEFARFSHTIFITTPAQVAAMNAITNTPACGNVQFSLNTLADVRNVTCPGAFLVAISSCPVWYDIVSVSGNTVRLSFSLSGLVHLSVCRV